MSSRQFFNAFKLIVIIKLFFLAQFSVAEILVIDDAGQEHKLQQPLQRIVSLMPHATELMFEIAADDLLVGAVEYSDYPEAAKKVPRVGGYSALNIEAIVAARPDMILAWPEGNRGRELQKLRDLKLPILVTDPRDFKDIARAMTLFGQITGRNKGAEKAINRFNSKYNQLQEKYSQQKTLAVFYQVWNAPLMTQNGDTFISRAIELCGGINIFAGLPMTNPQISIEAILVNNPDVIVASGMGEARPEWLDDWRQYKELKAVQNNNLLHIPPQLLQRPTSRLLQGTELLCEGLAQAR